MNVSEDLSGSIKRRSVLRVAAFAGATGYFLRNAMSQEAGAEEQTTAEGEGLSLANLEDGLDGWSSTDGNEISRVSAEEVPSEVVDEGYGIVVSVKGDLSPSIENERRVREVDFSENPYLAVRVIGQANQTDSEISFKSRLHYTPPERQGNGGSRLSEERDGSEGLWSVLSRLVEVISGAEDAGRMEGKRGESFIEDTNVIESEVKTVPQGSPQTVQWKFGDVSDEKLSSVNRLEIVWYLEDYEPDEAREENEDFDYEGFVIFGDIRVSASPSQSVYASRRQKMSNLRRRHGMMVGREVDEISEGFERGRYIFADGTEIEYSFEVVGERQYIETIGGEEFKKGEGWPDERD